VHALSALSGVAYLCRDRFGALARYSYLLELSEVLAHGPSYDPGDAHALAQRNRADGGRGVLPPQAEARPIGVLAVSLANLYALENLHGRAAFNHALFICAAGCAAVCRRTRRWAAWARTASCCWCPTRPTSPRLEQLARQIRDRLCRPVSLSTSRDPAGLEAAGTAWVADVGIGVLGTNTQVRPSQAVRRRAPMARTAWSYPSRMAFFDEQAARSPSSARRPGLWPLPPCRLIPRGIG
jgi:hypothetical protein